jgi:hypothetical protein
LRKADATDKALKARIGAERIKPEVRFEEVRDIG